MQFLTNNISFDDSKIILLYTCICFICIKFDVIEILLRCKIFVSRGIHNRYQIQNLISVKNRDIATVYLKDHFKNQNKYPKSKLSMYTREELIKDIQYFYDLGKVTRTFLTCVFHFIFSVRLWSCM